MLKDIIAISGKPGLYKLLSSANNSIIVEALEGAGKRFPVFGASQVSALQDIAIYTDITEERLTKVLQNIYDELEGKECTIVKGDAKELSALMEAALPNYDKDRVYPSDMKKIFSWYNILLRNNMLPINEEETATKE